MRKCAAYEDIDAIRQPRVLILGLRRARRILGRRIFKHALAYRKLLCESNKSWGNGVRLHFRL